MNATFKDMAFSIIASIISGVILWRIQVSASAMNYYLLVIIAVAAGCFVCFAIFVFRCKSLGISEILPSSAKGKGTTTAYMKSANSSICFVGIAASKWIIDSDELEKTIRKICSLNTGHIKFLLLNPESKYAQKMSLAGSYNKDKVGKKIEESLNSLKEIVKRLKENHPQALDNFEVRLYDQMPVFRLAVIDNRRAYFCFYQLGCNGDGLKQFVIKPKKNSNSDEQNIFNSMSEYFDCLWSSPTTVPYNLS